MKIVLTLLVMFSVSFKLFSQGCSDAGFCTIEALKKYEPIDSVIQSSTNSISCGITYGQTANNISIFTPYVEYAISVSKKISSALKITSAFHNGNVITKFKPADVIIGINYKLKQNLIIVSGIKLPFTTGNERLNGNALPMAYQASLGTFDGIIGIHFQHKTWSVTGALQQPILQNRNEFDLETTKLKKSQVTYYKTSNYRRNGDILLRLSKAWKLHENTISISLLPIYHLNNDSYINNMGEQIEHTHSQGLTFNSNVFFTQQISQKNSLEYSIGAPIHSRKVRPDYSIAIELTHKL